jgi:hypothetical protein
MLARFREKRRIAAILFLDPILADPIDIARRRDGLDDQHTGMDA